MGEVSIIGLDLAKNVFQAHGAGVDGSVVFRRKLSRAQLLKFMAAHLALHGRRHHFFETSSFIAARSSICSANSFFSLAFSSSSAFSRFASDTVMPPNLAFQL